MYRRINRILSLIAVGAALMACSQAETNSTSSEGARTISGKSQKGPFLKGSEITLYGMDERLRQTGAKFSTKVENSRGEYSLRNVNLDDRYAWLNANGYYLDEITRDTSAQKISLNSLVDLQDRDHVNINVLTHLSFDRIRYLVKEGKSVEDAKRQAEKEVMAAFGFSDEGESFDQLDIMGRSEGDAKLLAVSLIMLTAKDIGEVTTNMAMLAIDLEKDGVWDDTTLKNELKKNVSMENQGEAYKRARRNLIDMGADEISDFEKLINQFAAPWDSAWGLGAHCGNLDDVKDGYICRNGVWKWYNGARTNGDAPVDTAGKYGTLVDDRDGAIYKTLDVKMKDGETVSWMVSNLGFKPSMGSDGIREWFAMGEMGSPYHVCQALDAPDEETCESEAYRSEIKEKVLRKEYVQGACPEGWHLPQSYEWQKLEEATQGDAQTQELLLYPRFTENESDYKIAQWGSRFSLDEDREFFGPEEPTSAPPAKTIYEVRCVKD